MAEASPSPKAYHSFVVQSGCLCFGALHNIWNGSLAPNQGFPSVRPETNGTIRVQQIEYNVAAENGTWTAYKVVNIAYQNDVVGWFVCHSSINPLQELKKILQVAGSPYEAHSGSNMNDDETAEKGVFVINRYDWSFYDDRHAEDGEEDNSEATNEIGLVDYAFAQEQVKSWRRKDPQRRKPSKSGVWMPPGGEYVFGRFGFNDAHTAARSFLVFSSHTVFAESTLEGLSATVRVVETPEEIYQRQLTEGYDFSGLKGLASNNHENEPGHGLLPEDAELLGPYEPSEYLFSVTDLRAFIIARPNIVTSEIERTWEARTCELLNETFLSWLEHTILPHTQYQATVQISAEALFPHQNINITINSLSYGQFLGTAPRAEGEPAATDGFDITTMESQVKKFLESRSPDGPLLVDHEFIEGMCRVIGILLSEILDISETVAHASSRAKLVPQDIRYSLSNDEEVLELFKYSRVFWQGGVATET